MKTKLSIISTLIETLELTWRNRLLVVVLSILGACPTIIFTSATLSLKPPMLPDTKSPTSEDLAKMSSQLPIFMLETGLLAIGMLTAQILLQAGVTAILLGKLKTGPMAGHLWATAIDSLRRYGLRLVILVILLTIIAIIIVMPFSILIAIFGFSINPQPGGHVTVHNGFIAFMAALMAILYLIFVKYALAHPLVVIEEMNPIAALARSWQMTRGFGGYVFGSYVFVGTAEYFIGVFIQQFESPDQMSAVKAIELLVTSLLQCYWILLAWCMFWRIRDAENAKVSVSPPEWPSAAQNA